MLLLIVVAATCVFSLLAVIAAELYRAERYRTCKTPACSETEMPPVSVLKPLHGKDEGLAENLRSFFEQDYPAFEILLAVESADDPAADVVRELMGQYPSAAVRLVIAGPSPFPNAKVHSLRYMLAQARHDLLVMADSDVRVGPDFLRTIAGEMNGANVALVTCPYRAVAGSSFWSRLEAVGLNTGFIAGVLVARMLGGMDFALGPAIATRKSDLAEIGGMDGLQPYLAEDFVMGHRLAKRGRRVLLSSYVIEHRIGSQPLGANLAHRLRWNRSTRCSRPFGYIGQLFTYPLPLAVALGLSNADAWPLAIGAIALRYLAAWRTGHAIGARPAYLWLPAEDFASIGAWLAGFFGNEITWRARRFTIDRWGRFQTPQHGLESTNDTRQ